MADVTAKHTADFARLSGLGGPNYQTGLSVLQFNSVAEQTETSYGPVTLVVCQK